MAFIHRFLVFIYGSLYQCIVTLALIGMYFIKQFVVPKCVGETCVPKVSKFQIIESVNITNYFLVDFCSASCQDVCMTLMFCLYVCLFSFVSYLRHVCTCILYNPTPDEENGCKCVAVAMFVCYFITHYDNYMACMYVCMSVIYL